MFNVRFSIFYIIETYFGISFLSKYIILYSILSDIIYSFPNFNILTSIYFYLSIHIFFRRGYPGSAGFHCILEPLTLHMCHGSLTALQPVAISVISVWFFCNGSTKLKPKTKKTRNQKNNKKQNNDKTQLSATTPPLGVCSLVFFVGFLGLLVSYFLVRCWFFLQWLTRQKTQKTRNQNNTKPKKQKMKNTKQTK